MFLKNKSSTLSSQAGFSLVELMIVVAIIGLLAAVGVPQYQKFQARARQSEAKAALGALFSAEQSFFGEWNGYSTNLVNIGFGVTGQNLRYVTGFDAACTNYAPSASSSTNAGAPPETTGFTLSTNATVSPGATFIAPTAGTAASILTAADCNNAIAGATFVGVSVGDPKNTPTSGTTLSATSDRWSINQVKLLSNQVSGL